MFCETLGELTEEGFCVKRCTIDKDASCQEILLENYPECEIIILNFRYTTNFLKTDMFRQHLCHLQCKNELHVMML